MLLSGNKITSPASPAGRYLLYAIGEIVLVVIGIMIAVSLNNWNELMKQNIKSKDYLERLLEDVNVVIDDLENQIEFIDRTLRGSRIVQEALELGNVAAGNQEAVDRYFRRYYQFQLTIQDANTYNEMLYAGELGLIESRWIRETFANLSDNRDFLMEVNQANHNAILQNADMFETYIRYQFEGVETDATLTFPKNEFDAMNSIPTYDFRAMSADDVFINKISRQSKSWSEILMMTKSHKSSASQLRDSIHAELHKFN